MIKNVIILTLSLKFNNLCIAAYDPSNNKIIRLVKDTSIENGIPRTYVRSINLLDEVRINILKYCPKEHQTENVLIDLKYGDIPSIAQAPNFLSSISSPIELNFSFNSSKGIVVKILSVSVYKNVSPKISIHLNNFSLAYAVINIAQITHLDFSVLIKFIDS